MRAALAIVLLITALYPQGPSSEMVRANGAFIAVVVRDVDASVEWYQENLGLRLVKKGMSPRGHAGNVVLAGEGFYLELIYFVKPQAERPTRAADGSIPPGITKAGAVLTAKEFDDLFARLDKKKATFLGGIFQDKEMGMRSFIVEDNEENLIQFFAPL